MKKSFLSLFLAAILSCSSSFPESSIASKLYRELNDQEPFVLSFGTSMSQTHQSENTTNPSEMRKRLQELAQKSADPRAFFSHKEHIGYVLRALPNMSCQKCGKNIEPTKLDLIADKNIISKLVDSLVHNITADKLTVTACPKCAGSLIEQPREEITLTSKHQQAMITQIDYLGVKNQRACTEHGLPTYRISVEASDILQPNSTEIDFEKLQKQAAFLQRMGNPLVFCHHYANPQSIPDLFEKQEHIAWFANYCASIANASPHITHICPISQPVAFSHRVSRGSLPPFESNIPLNEYLKNITEAQVQACKQIKKDHPKMKVLMSHQWKPMKPLHGMLNGWYLLERLVCSIADRMYNGAFVKMLQPHQDLFDGIALSVYPALHFNGWIPQGDNSIDYFSADEALEAIMSTHAAFPDKDIYIVETGCNTKDPERKRAFIEMILSVSKIARDKGVKIKGAYLWAHTNDEKYYSEWGLQPGTTNFSPFDRLDPENPCSSINAGGLYLKEILSQP